MNKTLLLIIIDFLFLNLIALTRWEKAEPVRPKQPPVPEVAANSPAKSDDLVETMRQSLADEQAARADLQQKLAYASTNLTSREQSLAAEQAEKSKLAASLADTQRNAAELSQQVTAATQESSMTKDQLAQLQRELEDKQAEAERQKQQIASLQKSQDDARRQIEGLTVAVVVGEAEKQHLREEADTLKTQVQAERDDRLRVQAQTTQLAQGVGKLAEKSGELTQEIRENRPINANVLFHDFLSNRVITSISTTRKGLFGRVERKKDVPTVLITDGQRTYALLHIADTVFSVLGPNFDWDKVEVDLAGPNGGSAASGSLDFLALDSRVIVAPLNDAQASSLGAKVYHLAKDPFKFPEAVLINVGGKGYGAVGFKLDPLQPNYVKVDNRFFKRLFGDFSPSRGDLVLSQTGELLGIMVNSDYCALLNDFTPADTIRTGDATSAQHTGQLLDGLAARIQALPLPLQ
jgi:hypothetical protein